MRLANVSEDGSDRHFGEASPLHTDDAIFAILLSISLAPNTVIGKMLYLSSDKLHILSTTQ